MASVIASETRISATKFDRANPLPMDSASPFSESATKAIKRGLFMLLAVLSLVLAVAGVVLPLLPCTPFLLLGSFFLFRASPSLHTRFLKIRWIGSALSHWQKSRAVTPTTKWQACLAIAISVLATLLLTPPAPWVLCVMLCGSGAGLFVIWRLPSVRT